VEIETYYMLHRKLHKAWKVTRRDVGQIGGLWLFAGSDVSRTNIEMVKKR
jgi:hypothetical protein